MNQKIIEGNVNSREKKLKLPVFSDLTRVSIVIQKGKNFEPGQHIDPIPEAFHVPTVLHRTVYRVGLKLLHERELTH